jgi:alpha-amylase/alpha-mannosidase (GH57 family)
MSADRRLKIVLCWHMHQPQYQNMISGEYLQPWTYLHASKDYVDMAAHLEAEPAARAVVNFAPTLLDQLADYAEQVRGFLREGKAIRDPLLAALGEAALPCETEEILTLVRACLRAHRTRLIDRFPAYQKLAGMADWCLDHPEAVRYLTDQFLADLLVWYHLAWLGETVRRTDARVRALQEKANSFTLHDRRVLTTIIGELLSGLVDRYKRLSEEGRVELSVSPYAHPILPLLLDLKSIREAMPDASLPGYDSYPGGRERADWHIREAITSFERYFGFPPDGCWPSEGSVSTLALQVLEQHGFRWAATGETVLFNSIHEDESARNLSRERTLYRPYHVKDGRLACFFRDDGLSDLVGFTYSDWHADDAVANLLHHLEAIADSSADDEGQRVVSIILDGENAWEHYPNNGYYFLSELYRQLSGSSKLHLTTFSACLAEGVETKPLQQLVAGSWVYGTFSTWMGDPDKNRAWDMLIDAKHVFDRVQAQGDLDAAQLRAAQRQLAICEGSDWFWWFGDYNPSHSVHDFDRLYRMHLSNLYQLLYEEPPDYLAHSFSHGSDSSTQEAGGVMRHGQPAV